MQQAPIVMALLEATTGKEKPGDLMKSATLNTMMLENHALCTTADAREHLSN